MRLVRLSVTTDLLHRHRPQGTRVQLLAAMEAAVDDHSAANKRANVDVQRTTSVNSIAGDHLRSTGGSGIVKQRHRQARCGLEFGSNINFPPRSDRLTLQTEHIRPFVQDPGHCNAESDDSRVQALIQGIDESKCCVLGEVHCLRRKRSGIGYGAGCDDGAAEVYQEGLETAASDLDTKREGTFRIQ